MSVASVALKIEKKQTSCTYCGVGCGLDIEIHNDVPVALTGAKTHPANQGRICVKGTNLLDTVGAKGRMLSPTIDQVEVSWPTATAHVANRFSEILKQHGKDSVALYLSGQLLTEDYYVANKFMKGYIGSANIDTNSRLCMSSAVTGYKRAFGEDVVPCNYEDLEHADVIFIIGSNAAWTHPVLFQRMQAAKQANPALKFVAIDPRETATTKLADIHLPISPGSDAGFYNGLLQYLVEQQVIDKDYITQSTKGFEQAIIQAQPWSIDKVSDFCGIDEVLIEQAFRLFAFNENVISFYSMGINQSNSGADKCNAIINCHLATGKLAKLGTGPFSITGQPNAMGGREVGGLSNQLCAHLDIDDTSHQQLLQSFWQSPTMVTEAGTSATEIIEHIEQGKIKAIWIMATNPLVSLPDRSRVSAALKKCELVVVSDCVDKNDTLEFAHVKLPATTWLEKDGTVTNSERVISRQRGMIKAPGQAKHDWKIICDIAKKMGFKGFDFEHAYQVFNEYCQLSGVANATERLFNISVLAPSDKQQYDTMKPTQWPIKSDRPFYDGKFSTADKKAHFIAITPALPVLINNKTNKGVGQGNGNIYFPFVLNSGRIRDQWHTMTRTSAATQLNEHISAPKLAINPADAKKLGIKDDNWVKVESISGEVFLEADISEDIQPGHCFMPIHWNKQFASNANTSSVFPTVIDPVSKQPQLKQVSVRLEKLTLNLSTKIVLHDQYVERINPDKLGLYRKTLHQHCHSYQMAEILDDSNVETVFDEKLLTYKQMLGEDIQWLSFLSVGTGIGRFVGTIEGKLAIIIECSDLTKHSLQSETNTRWLEYLFAETSLSQADKIAIVKAKPGDEFLLGKQICSCFNVHEKTIEQAILDGEDSLDKLAKSIKCGSGCGSCKPDLSEMIHACSVRERTEIASSIHDKNNIELQDIITMEAC